MFDRVLNTPLNPYYIHIRYKEYARTVTENIAVIYIYTQPVFQYFSNCDIATDNWKFCLKYQCHLIAAHLKGKQTILADRAYKEISRFIRMNAKKIFNARIWYSRD